MRRHVPVFLLAILPFALSSAHAQSGTPKSSGYVWGFAFGAGSGKINPTGVSFDREIGGVANLWACYAPSPRYAVGLELTGWTGKISGTQIDQVVFGPSVTFSPAAGRVYARVTFGLGSSSTGIPGSGVTTDDTGLGAAAAVGGRVPIAGRWTLNPEVQYGYTNQGNDFNSSYVGFVVGLGTVRRWN